MGITLLVNPDCPFSVTHLPSTSLYSLSCQVSHFLIHCLYLPPSLSDEECIQVLNDLPLSSNSSQTNTIFCGDFNARHRQILGDSLTSPRGHRVFDWANNLGLTCWNEQLAKGVPTYYTQHGNQIKKSIIDLFFSLTDELINPRMEVIQNSHMGSTHFPVSLSLLCAQTPIGQPNHPRLLWKLAKLQELPVRQLYQDLFAIKASPLLADLRDLVKYSIDLYKGRIDNSFTSTQDSSSSFSLDTDDLTVRLTALIHSCLDQVVGRQKPRLSSNAWYWTDNLQSLFDARENAHRQWRRATPGSIGKALLWKEYCRMYQSFTVKLKWQRRQSWNQFCEKLSSDLLEDTVAALSRMKKNRTRTPAFAHPQGPQVAANVMADHLQDIYAGDFLSPPHQRRSKTPRLPTGPNLTDSDVQYLEKKHPLV
ncbi:hypothetical protein CU098_006659 [Rhizopus stolonifer]|uniref:Endonuclease/exonuclease/phosphatase domain-containing protein n=1 Tax=Rhizopus stolonifer TaxID=4846 RepID=A0A367JIU2_RHIST|nr:hypothetical protein CU098_006659 [Rhizopus stolonifer]